MRFKDVAYKNLAIQVRPAEKVSSNFRMQRLSDFYYSWGAGAADVDHDNVHDVISGPHVFYGPDYTRRSEIYLQLTTNPSDNYTTDAWMQFVSDFTGDGWGDALNCSFAGDSGCYLYVNPKGEPRRWDKHLVVRGVSDRNRRAARHRRRRQARDRVRRRRADAVCEARSGESDGDVDDP